MKKTVLLVTLILAIAFVGSAFASKNVLEFAGGKMGKVTFDGKAHSEKIKDCGKCHKGEGAFPMKKPGAEGSAKITAPHKAGEFCFKCHNGKEAFTTEGNCAKCHKK
jgi:c(7)-type cytochrome triheme protein